MSTAALPAVIAVGAGVYVLTQMQTPAILPAQLPPPGSTNYPPYDPMGLSGQYAPGESAKVDALMAAAAAKYDQLSQEGRTQAAQYINDQLNPQPPLTGNESWQEVASIAGGAVGGAIGGPLGAIAGAYVGTTLETWFASDIQAIEDWIKQNAPGAINSVVHDLEHWLGI